MTHHEYMQSVGQITIDDILSVQESVHMPSTMIDVGDTVRITLTASDELTINYFKYYYPHVINKTGYVVDGKQLTDGHYIYLVDVLGEKHWMNQSDIAY